MQDTVEHQVLAEAAIPGSHQKSSLCHFCLGKETNFTLQGKSVQFPTLFGSACGLWELLCSKSFRYACTAGENKHSSHASNTSITLVQTEIIPNRCEPLETFQSSQWEKDVFSLTETSLSFLSGWKKKKKRKKTSSNDQVTWVTGFYTAVRCTQLQSNLYKDMYSKACQTRTPLNRKKFAVLTTVELVLCL